MVIRRHDRCHQLRRRRRRKLLPLLLPLPLPSRSRLLLLLVLRLQSRLRRLLRLIQLLRLRVEVRMLLKSRWRSLWLTATPFRPLLPSRTTTRVHWRLRLLMMLAMVWAVGRIATELPIAVFGQLLLPVAHASRNCQVAVASSPSACCRSPCHYDCVGDCSRYCSCCCSEPCCCCDGNACDCGRACCG